MTVFRRRPFATAVVVLVAVALAAALTAVWQRHRVERANRTVELVMDYDSLHSFAAESGIEFDELARQVRQTGVTSMAVPDHSLEELNELGRMSLLPGEELSTRSAFLETGPKEPVGSLLHNSRINPAFTYIITEDSELAGTLVERLPLSLETGLWDLLWPGDAGQWVFELRCREEQASELHIGVEPRLLSKVEALGFRPVSRPTNLPRASTAWYVEQFQSWKELGARSVIFAGDEAPGYPDRLEAVAEAMEEADLTLGLIESRMLLGHVAQRGLRRLSQEVEHTGARVYSIPRPYLWERPAEEIVDIWKRAVKERNIRMVYLRPILTPGKEKQVTATVEAFNELSSGLSRMDYELGPASTFEQYAVPKALQAAIALGAAAATLLLLDRFLRGFAVWRRLRYGLLLIGAASVGVFWVPGGELPVKAAGLLIAVVAPSLALDSLVRMWARARASAGSISWYSLGIRGTVLVFGFSLAGALALAGLMGDIEYMLEWEFFRGVKLSLVAPLLVASVSYVSEFGFDETPSSQRTWLAAVSEFVRQPVRVWHVVLTGTILLAVAFFVSRSGNVARELVPQYELVVRQFLEDTLRARPRTKEFLIGYPALVLGSWFAAARVRGLLYPLFIAAGVGQVSLVNTFEHLRTPVAISILRSFNGLWLGLLIGYTVTFAWHLVYSRWFKEGGR